MKDIQPKTKTNTAYLNKKAKEKLEKEIALIRKLAKEAGVKVDLSPKRGSNFDSFPELKSKKYVDPKAKDRRAKLIAKKEKEKRADIRDAARGKMTLAQSKVSGKLKNIKKELNKLKKANLTTLKGRR